MEEKSIAGKERACCAYLLRCADGSLYCGWTNDISRRLRAHNAGKGAKYTRSRLPVSLAYLEPCTGPRQARQREARIKRMSKAAKEALAMAYQAGAAAGPVIPKEQL